MSKWSKQDHRLVALVAWVALLVAWMWMPSYRDYAAGITNTVTIYEADGVLQTNAPRTFNRPFAQGEIVNCPQPLVNGTLVTGSNWQADVTNRWPDGSVRIALISLIVPTLSAAGNVSISFQNNGSTCNNTGYITTSSSPSFATFNGGNYDAQIKVSPGGGGAPVTTSAKAMLAASDPGLNTRGDCKNNYFAQGPVLTGVIVQDCTNTMAYDFGWPWNGGAMGSPATGASAAASFHPMFILWFYTSINAVECEEIIENDWNGKAQDQLADFLFATDDAGGTPHTRWSRTGARVVAGASATTTINFEPTQSTATVTASGANFVSTDVGLGACLVPPGNPNFADLCGTVQSVTNTTTAVILLPSGSSSETISSDTLYLDLVSTATRTRKTFWSGTPPGHIRIDYNFPYLISTTLVPSYDLANASINPHNGYYPGGKCCDYGYDGWIQTDRGEIAGFSGMPRAWSGALEGAPLQRADLALLYNMGTCGTQNGYCAVALQQLTGLSALGDPGSHAGLDTSTVTQYDVLGGGGMEGAYGSVPFHWRESRTAPTESNWGGLTPGSPNCFYVSQFENKNAQWNATASPSSFSGCLGGGDGNVTDPTGPNNATGKMVSQYAHPDAGPGCNAYGISPIGSALTLPNWWDICDEGNYHWLDYSYLPYLLGGSPYFLETEYQAAAWQVYASSFGTGIFNTINSGYIYRELAWVIQTFSRAAILAPDGSAEQAYWNAQINSNLETLEGALGITSTTLTPAVSQGAFATSGTINNYNWTASNRWDQGRYLHVAGDFCDQTPGSGSCPIVTPSLHQWSQGFCDNSYPTWDHTLGASGTQYWMYWYVITVLGEMRDMGFSRVASVHNQTEQFLEGMTSTPTGNPVYALVSYESPLNVGNGTAVCTSVAQNLPFFTRYGGSTGIYGTWLASYGNPTSLTQQGNFGNSPPPGGQGTGNFPCADHGYSLLARAAGTFLPSYPVTETDADGTYTAAATWNYLNLNIPYWNNLPAQNLPTDCPLGANNASGTVRTYDVTIKWDLTPRGPAPNTSVITVASTNPSTGVNITASPADINSISSGNTSFTLTYNNGTAVQLVAPSSASGNAFVNWSGCDSSVGTTCSIAPNTNRTITANYATPPSTATLTIASTNPASGVVISASPNDNGGHSSATTPGSLVYNVGASVTLTAPSTAGGNPFSNWTGCTSTSGLTCNVTVAANATITANYTAAPSTFNLTVASTNPASGVVVTNSPADNGSNTSTTTPGTLVFNPNVAVTLTAPSTAGGNNFANWTGCDLASGTQCNVTMNANRTVTANYSTPPATVTVNVHSGNPTSSVTIATSPADNNGHANCVTPCAFVYNAGASFTLTAPSTAGGNSFSSWSACPSPSSNTCAVASAINTSITANYASPPTITLSVASQNPATGTTITVVPSDNGGHSSTVTPGNLVYNASTSVQLTAPSTAGGNNFSSWLGCTSVASNVCTIVPASNATVTAVYTTPPTPSTITITSAGASSVVMAAQPADLANKTGGTTSFTLSYNNGTAIQIVAPATSGGAVFRSWAGCTTTAGTTCNLTVTGNATLTANYSAAPPAPTGLTIKGWISALISLSTTSLEARKAMR